MECLQLKIKEKIQNNSDGNGKKMFWKWVWRLNEESWAMKLKKQTNTEMILGKTQMKES